MEKGILMKKKPGIKEKIFIIVIWLGIIAILSSIAYVYITYGGKPIDEIPSWTIPFFFGRR